MRYEQVANLVRLAVRLQGTLGGLTLGDIQDGFSVSRSTAERMRDAVAAAFGPLELVDSDDRKRRWRLRSDAVRRLVAVSPAELAELESAASALERAGLEERAATLREFATTVRATLRTDSLARVESELEALVQAEGLAMRAGPRARLDPGLLSKLREAVTTRRMVEFRYFARATGRHSRQRVRPLGLLYGNRAFLVASSDWREEPRLWRLANVSDLRIITDETFERDPEFDLERYAKRSFGTFQEKPAGVVLRFDAAAARDASTFIFHPDQSTESNDDGSLTVRFEAGGIDEMCWHLFTWGESVTIEEPLRLRRRLSEMSARLAAHHGGTARSMNETATSGDAASVPAGAGSFGQRERKRQAAFRKGLTTPTDAVGLKHDYLLALGCEEENLFPTLRGENGAIRYFAERNVKWWQARVSGDASDGKRPTRNMASSQIACVNFLLPLVDIPGALTAVLKAIDDDVTGVVDIEHEGTPSPVELEWIGLDHALEGEGVKTRGANSTSVDAFMVAETRHGRHAYLMEWKYVEEYRTEDKGQGPQGETRRKRYAHLYEKSPSFNRKVPFDAWLFEPFYQILRLRLLADRMVRNRELGVTDAKVVVVVPEGNLAYRERVTSPPLAMAFPDRKVSGIVEETLVHPNHEYASVSQSNLADSVRSRCGDETSIWSAYHRDRYGW